jgi:hypothetical protein
MKINLIIFYLLFVFVQVRSQNIEGIWQYDTNTLADGYHEVYLFKKNSLFEFHTSQYDALKRINSIGGKYTIKKDTLLFYVSYTLEVIGGNIVRSDIYSKNDSWEIENGLLDTIYYHGLNVQKAMFKIKEENSQRIIYIDGYKYFKVDNNPDNYK